MSPDYRAVHPETGVVTYRWNGWLGPALRGFGILQAKRIPESYFVASIAQRRALLQGLVDTDGHVTPKSGRVRYVSHNEGLARDVCVLARTLGHRATVYTETDRREPHEVVFASGRRHLIRTAGTRWVASWTPHDGEPQGRLPRKQVLRSRPADKVGIVSIEPAEPADDLCIEVDRPDGLFLAGPDLIPTHNSRFMSRAVPAWYLGMFPDRRVIATSYSEDLIRGWSSEARDIIDNFGEELFGVTLERRNADDWTIAKHGGGMRAVPHGGQITGFGGNLIIIDDPIKDELEAESQRQREQLWSFFTRRLRNRLEPNGKILLVMARWHEDDIRARLTDASRNEFGDQWEVVHLPTIAEPAPDELDEHGRLLNGGSLEGWRDVMGRRSGEALWPERWPLAALRRLRASIGPAAWNANLQQRPVSASGDIFNRHKWVYCEPPDYRKVILVRGWDLAGTDEGGDWTVGVLLGLDAKKSVYLVDVVRHRYDPAAVKDLIADVAAQDAALYGSGKVWQQVEQEGGSSGKGWAEEIVREELGGHSAEAKGVSGGSKVLRARPFAAQQLAGNVAIVKVARGDGSWAQPLWAADYVNELADFDKGVHDDQVDALVDRVQQGG